MALASTPEPPYYAVIFTSRRTAGDRGYAAAAERMVELASRQAGFLGIESVRDESGEGITVSYWRALEDIESWRRDEEHLSAQRAGRATWYAEFRLRICRVERQSAFGASA